MPELNVSRIVGLHTENVMRLKAVDLTPPEHLVIVGGDNDQGKSSLLASIEMALAGADAFPEMPVRKGQKRAVSDLDLGDLKVHRTISANGSTTLTVKGKDGCALDSPQKILDALRGNRSFDPMEFMRLKDERQADVLRQIAGLDFTAIDAEYKALFDERTVVNREVAQKKGALSQLPPHHADAPKEETSAASVLEEQRKASEVNRLNQRQRESVSTLEETLRGVKQRISVANSQQAERTKRIATLKQEIETLEERIAATTTEIGADVQQQSKVEGEIANAREAIKSLADVDIAQFGQKLRDIETTNRKVRENKARADAEKNWQTANAKSEALTRQLSALETKKSDTIQAAKFPVPGLGFMDSGAVAYNGVPFSQASTSVQLKVSVAIGLALNPKLRILLIRNGNDLDEKNLALLADMAREHKAQVWIERVQKTGEVAVVIEDGSAVAVKAEQQEMTV